MSASVATRRCTNRERRTLNTARPASPPGRAPPARLRTQTPSAARRGAPRRRRARIRRARVVHVVPQRARVALLQAVLGEALVKPRVPPAATLVVDHGVGRSGASPETVFGNQDSCSRSQETGQVSGSRTGILAEKPKSRPSFYQIVDEINKTYNVQPAADEYYMDA